MSHADSIARERDAVLFSRTSAIALIAIVLFISLIIIKPAAPKKVVLLTGPEGSGYHELGGHFATYLEEKGLQTEVKITGGGFDNVNQLIAGTEDAVAFAPSNIEYVIDGSRDTSHLVTLGSIAYEPLWLFFRASLDIERIPDLAGLRVATGAEGTVVNYLSRRLLEMNGVTDQSLIQPSQGQKPEVVADALIDDRIDVAFVKGGPESPVVKRLLVLLAIDCVPSGLGYFHSG